MTLWALNAATLLVLMVLSYRVGAVHAHLVEHIDRKTFHLKEHMTVSTQDAINEITAVLQKARKELTDRLVDLQAQLEAAGVADKVDLGELTAVAQALDDIVPDAVSDVVDES